MKTLKEMRQDGDITAAQYARAQNLTNYRVNSDGELWASNNRNQRLLIDRAGEVVFDGKQLTKQ